MLEFRNDRLDYGRILIPPEGYQLDRAIAAAYSVDLNTLLSIPVALFYSQTLEGKIQGERFQLLEAIQRTARAVTVYCHKGRIHVPDRYNRLYAFMEQMIVPVEMDNAFSSFHPKVWILRYDHPAGQTLYRLLILSRNLTYDRNWDLAVALEGKLGASSRPTNRPLLDFVGYLHRLKPIEGYTRFIRDLAKVRFEAPEYFDRVAFQPLGIPGYLENPALIRNTDEALCMSPFLDDATLKQLRKGTRGKLWLFGRRREMAKLEQAAVASCEAYCISDRVVEGEREAADESNLDCLEQDLHAKLFVFQEGDQARWLVGSANATTAARERNVEFMVELTGSHRDVSLEKARTELLDPGRDLDVFERFDPESAGVEDANAVRDAAVRRLEFAVSRVPIHAIITQAANGTNFDLAISLDFRAIASVAGLAIRVVPLSCGEAQTEAAEQVDFAKLNQLLFANISEADLSRFLAFTISAGEETLRRFLLQFEIEGLPDTRLDRITKSIVSSTEHFFEYLRFLLTEEFSKTDFHNPPLGRHKKRSDPDDLFFGPDLPLFESIIVAASRDPAKMRAVDSVIRRLSAIGPNETPLVPPEFLAFWEIFRPMIQNSQPTEANHA
jgi:hypothetical protein